MTFALLPVQPLGIWLASSSLTEGPTATQGIWEAVSYIKKYYFLH